MHARVPFFTDHRQAQLKKKNQQVRPVVLEWERRLKRITNPREMPVFEGQASRIMFDGNEGNVLALKITIA